MKNRSQIKIFTLLTLGLALFVGCAQDEDDFFFDPNANLNRGFQVILTSPTDDEDNVNLQERIRITFNRSLDRSSVPGNITVFENSRGGSSDVTSQFAIDFDSFRILDDTIVLRMGRNLTFDVDYSVTVSQGVRSINQESLFFQKVLLFYTGDRGSLGAASRPGPPELSSMNIRYGSGGDCLYVRASFNEDLSGPPIGIYEVSALRDGLNIFGWEFDFETDHGDMYAIRTYANNNRVWNLFFSGDSCNPNWWENPAARIKITMTEFYDASGERNARDFSEHFDAYLDY